MADYRIAIDAGHGGSDPGAVYKGRQEKEDTLDLTLAVGDILKKNGIDVYYTRTLTNTKLHLRKQPMRIIPVPTFSYQYTAIPQKILTSIRALKPLYTAILV